MKYKNLKLEIENRIGKITINRPKKLNALNQETIKELHQAFQNMDADKAVGVIVIRGEGDKAFVAGADIAEFADYGEKEAYQLSANGQKQLFDFVENLATPVIAGINGFALGGGLELALACHIRVASDNARMGLPEVSLGVIPGYGGTQRLPQLIGKGRAFEMIMTGGMINVEQALDYGLINHKVTLEDLDELCEKIAQRILKNSPVAVSYAIKAVNAGFSNSQEGFEAEKEYFAQCFETEDFKEGTSAFLEKRAPQFPGS